MPPAAPLKTSGLFVIRGERRDLRVIEFSGEQPHSFGTIAAGSLLPHLELEGRVRRILARDHVQGHDPTEEILQLDLGAFYLLRATDSGHISPFRSERALLHR